MNECRRPLPETAMNKIVKGCAEASKVQGATNRLFFCGGLNIGYLHLERQSLSGERMIEVHNDSAVFYFVHADRNPLPGGGLGHQHCPDFQRFRWKFFPWNLDRKSVV